MCGIAGIMSLDGGSVDREVLISARERLAHRGPDAAGIWVEGPVGLAHRRLSVIDLETGGQPLARLDLKRVVVFNGEIYNYIELRKELVGLGHRFETQSDTEVLLVAQAQWGDDVFRRLRGMFAFAVWEMDRRRLVVARDPLGKKPLCFHYVPGKVFAFASEAKALLMLPGVSRRVNPDTMVQYLDLMYVPEQTRVWRDIARLAPGTTIAIDGRGMTTRRYFSPRLVDPPGQVSFEEACDRTAENLKAATRVRLRSDVPIGLFLSGGVDSTLVAMAAAAHMPGRLRTFTVGFDGRNDERPFARQVAERLGSDHVELDVRVSGPSLLLEVARCFDEPFGDTSALPLLAMARETKRHATVVLTGDGGDEVFAGYETYVRHAKVGDESRDPTRLRSVAGSVIGALRTRARQGPPWLARTAARLMRPLRGQIGTLVDASGADATRRHFEMMRVAHLAEPRKMLAPIAHGMADPAEALLADLPRGTTPLRSAMLFDHLVYLPGDILKKVDIATMATGLEIRSPLLDDDLMASAHELPNECLLQRDDKLPPSAWGKRVLKKLCEDSMGTDFTFRPKAGFALPLDDWLKDPGFVELARDGFASAGSPIRPWFEKDAASRVWDEFERGKGWLAQEVWNLMILDAWAREYHPAI